MNTKKKVKAKLIVFLIGVIYYSVWILLSTIVENRAVIQIVDIIMILLIPVIDITTRVFLNKYFKKNMVNPYPDVDERIVNDSDVPMFVFKNNVNFGTSMVIKCPTKQQAKFFCEKFLIGAPDVTVRRWTNYWDRYKEDTCYQLGDWTINSYGKSSSYNEYFIHDFSEIFSDKITASGEGIS